MMIAMVWVAEPFGADETSGDDIGGHGGSFREGLVMGWQGGPSLHRQKSPRFEAVGLGRVTPE